MKDVAVGRYALNAGDRDVLFLDMDGCDEEAWRALRDALACFSCFTGAPVTVDILLARAGDLPIRPVSDHSGDDLSRLVDLNNVTQQTVDDLRSAMWHPSVLADAQPKCGRHNAWASMGCRLAWFIGTEFENQARELWLEWSVAGGGSAADITEAERRWDEGKLVADRTGYQAILTRAQKEGWINPGAERMRLSSAASVDDFEDLTSTEVAEPAPLPPFRRDNKGAIEAIIDNVALALLRPTFTGVEIRYDIFRDAIMLAPKGTNGWRAFGDEDYSELRVILSRRSFKEVNKDLMRDAVFMVAKRQPFDSATTWLNGLEWDGVPRIEYFYHTHFGTADTPYTRAVSMYMWTALAGRVLEPGIKADMVPILVGAQGLRKSAGIAALSPDPEFFADISFADKDDDLARKMRGCLVAEISELRGLNTKDLESIKAWVTRTHDKWVPKFREFTTTFARRGIHLGSSNEDEFLADKTGNRRWLPVDVVEMVDTDAIARNRELLWAERPVPTVPTVPTYYFLCVCDHITPFYQFI
uniref:Virulence-associated protein E-like domain-containing protein n=1 Tax=Rhodnius prolixus TaxID=13249 RepID=T1I2W3_RHOPR